MESNTTPFTVEDGTSSKSLTIGILIGKFSINSVACFSSTVSKGETNKESSDELLLLLAKSLFSLSII